MTDLQVVGDLPLVGPTELAAWVDRLIAHLSPKSTSLAVRLVSDTEMQEINRTFRDQDRATDVLSFPGGKTPEDDHLGDIVIALGVAEHQARDTRTLFSL